MKKILLVIAAAFSFSVFAQEEEAIPMPINDAQSNRDPAQDKVPGKHGSEDDLRVLPALPDAVVKKDPRSVQNEVYKTIYNRDLKPDQREDILDE